MKKNNKKKIIITALVTVAVLAVLTPIAYKKTSSFIAEKQLNKDYKEYIDTNTVFFPNSILNGIDISGKTPSEAADIVTGDFASGKVEIYSERSGKSEFFSYGDLKINSANLTSYINSAFENQERTLDEFAGRVDERERVYSYNILNDVDFNNTDYSNVAFFDENLYTKPIDAHIDVNLATGECKIVEATNGTVADKNTVVPKIAEAIATKENYVSLDISDYAEAAIQSDDPELVAELHRELDMLGRTITLSVCGLTETIAPEKIRTFFSFSQEEGLQPDSAAVSEFVNYLANKYDSYNCLYTFNTSMGTTVSLDYGNYGWTINKEETVRKLLDALTRNGGDFELECAYINTCSRPTNALQGNSYFEVSLEYQKVWFYLNGELIVYDDCTTGDITVPESATFKGFFHVSEKKTETYLKGPTWYDFVHYWVRFDDSHANGFHDATWRSEEEFGGENRNGNGSHGCVNLRLDTAAIVYNNITFDMPVIVW